MVSNTEESAAVSESHKQQSHLNLDTREEGYNQLWLRVVKHDELQPCHKKKEIPPSPKKKKKHKAK